MRRARRRRGFTLIETIASITVLAALGTGTSVVLLAAIDSYVEANTTAQLHAELSVGMDRIVRELRKIPLDVTASGIAPDIDSMSSTAISWGTSSLTLSGTDLDFVDEGATSALLLANVSAFTLTAQDEDDAAVTLAATADDCDPIRRVGISITLSRQGQQETLTSEVFIRSTMSGGGT